jgi:argininosuccinate lyase
MTTNLPSGYHRDLQIIKESFIPAFNEINDCINIAVYALKNIRIKEDILKDPKYLYLFSVEVVNNMVLDGIPFRDAYKKVGQLIEEGKFTAPNTIHHTHQGSIGNLMNKEIREAMNKTLNQFYFERVHLAIEKLVK